MTPGKTDFSVGGMANYLTLIGLHLSGKYSVGYVNPTVNTAFANGFSTNSSCSCCSLRNLLNSSVLPNFWENRLLYKQYFPLFFYYLTL